MKYIALEKRDYTLCCDGYLTHNPVMGYLQLNSFDNFDHYTKSQSIGRTSFIFEHFYTFENTHIDDTGTNAKWGFVDNVLFTILGLYASIEDHNDNWYHIKIEGMK